MKNLRPGPPLAGPVQESPGSGVEVVIPSQTGDGPQAGRVGLAIGGGDGGIEVNAQTLQQHQGGRRRADGGDTGDPALEGDFGSD